MRLERLFRLAENGTTLRTEVAAGVTTFMAMAYIIFVQPAVLSQAGMDFGAVMAATCLSAAAATFVMAFAANYPIALAPGMGENFFFAFTVVLAMGVPWRTALGIVFISGVLFLFLTLVRLRERIVDAVPGSLKNGIAVGIGVFITFIGLTQAGLIVRNNAPLAPIAHAAERDPASLLERLRLFEYAGGAVKLGPLGEPATLLAIFGVLVTAALLVRRVRGAILLGMAATALAGLAAGLVEWRGAVAAPPSLAPTFLQMDWRHALTLGVLPVTLVFLYMDMFDTIGTLIGIGEAGGFMRNGRLPRARQALASDAVGTMIGAALGTSTVTSFVESAAGVEAGGRTGLASVVTGLLFCAAIFFSPIARMIGGGVAVGAADGLFLYPVTAPALIVVGAMMARSVVRIAWDDYAEAIPAFLVVIGIPLTYSIADGLAFGFISYPVLKLAGGRGREVSALVYVLGGIFLLRYLFL
ncbi:MAG: NCS2 family permease [bacterium]|nr:NCS2 family permease [bacterium]